MKIVFGFDLHNTILRSNDAWISALIRCGDKKYNEYITKSVYNKVSRKKIASEIGADYEEVLENYHNCVKPDGTIVEMIKTLEKNYSLYLISSASKEKVDRDLASWNGGRYFAEVLTKEVFDKSSGKDWSAFLDSRGIDLMIYIGNDIQEDIIHNPKVISLISGAFLEKLNDMGMFKSRGEETC